MLLDALHRAKSYPYKIPARSYVITGDQYEELAIGAPMPDLSGRRPVIAVGSNQSPEQLIRTFKNADWGAIPVLRARRKNFDIVYSSHIASYGSIPATLRHSPGTRVSLFVNWLAPKQEIRRHEIESATHTYHFGKLDHIELDLDLDRGLVLTTAFVYTSRRGALLREGHPVALKTIKAENRVWTAWHQEEIQNHARDRLAPGQPLDDFIHAAIADASIRQNRTEALMASSVAFNFSGFTPIEV